MRYAMWFEDKVGFVDSIIVSTAKERNLYIKNMSKIEFINCITYCPIYSSGEYGIMKEFKKLVI